MLAIKLLISALVLSTQASRVVESSSAFRAKMWLKTHDPSGDEAGMNDLKNSDPNAYAIVQALLTKKSLGLLDPSHPSVAFGASAPKEHKSFQEEAEEAGLTQDTPSEAVSQMEMQSSVPYPSAGADAAPYPQVRASHNPWNYKATHSDDDLVNSVIGGDAAAPAQPESDTMSLSAVAAQEQQSMPAPVEHYAAPAAPAAPLGDVMNGISLNWGNPMARSTEEAPAAPEATPAAQPEQDSSDNMLSLSAVRSQEESRMGITESADRFKPAPVVYAQPAPAAPVEPAPAQEVHSPLESNQFGLPSLNWGRPAQESLAAVAAPVVQPAPVEPEPVTMNSYATPSLGMTSVGTHMGSYRSSYRMDMHMDDATPTSDNILSLRKQNMGNSYDSFLKQARTNRWKRAMDVTMHMKPIGGAAGNNAYLNDLS